MHRDVFHVLVDSPHTRRFCVIRNTPLIDEGHIMCDVL